MQLNYNIEDGKTTFCLQNIDPLELKIIVQALGKLHSIEYKSRLRRMKVNEMEKELENNIYTQNTRKKI